MSSKTNCCQSPQSIPNSMRRAPSYEFDGKFLCPDEVAWEESFGSLGALSLNAPVK